MEVHHHPNVEKKNLKEYLLEGLMIFLAVSMGFLAENFREYIINREHEKQYVNTFYEDLKNDQNELPGLIINIEKQQLQPAGALPLFLSKTTVVTPADTIYYFFRKLIRQQGIRSFITDRTIEQVKNAGEIRLIKNKEVAETLIEYYKKIGFIDYLQQTLLGYKSKLIDNLPLILKSSDYAAAIDSLDNAIIPMHHVYLSNIDPLNVNRILIQVEEIRALSNTIKRQIELVLTKNKEIEKLIEAKYIIEK